MPRTRDKKSTTKLYLATSPWQKELNNAHAYYNRWDVRYKTKILEDYYKGFQWRNKLTNTNTINYEPYTMNMFYATIQIKLAGLTFQRPQFVLTPQAKSFWDEETAVTSCEIKQDALNTIIGNPNMKFAAHIKKAARDSYFRFGMIEVGYAADWRNPIKDDPLLSSHQDPSIQLSKDRIIEDNDVAENERIYVKRIRPDRFRVAVTDEWDLDAIPWYGYYQYYFRRTLQKTKGINWPSGYSPLNYSSNDYGTTLMNESQKLEDKEFLRLIADKEIEKVWHIWDNVAKKRLMLLDGHMQELWSEPFERRCLIDHRWEAEDGFYPVPPTFQWVSQQNEINEAREQTRSFRRRFTRKFQYTGNVDPEEIEKFTSGPDGVLIKVPQKDAISPIQNPEQGPTAENALILAKDDFNIISGTSSEARGQADRTTATQAKLVNERSAIRESAEQLDHSVFVCTVGREILATAAQKMEAEMWIKLTSNPSASGSSAQAAPLFKGILAQDLNDGYDFDIDLDVTNATPQTMQAGQQAYTSFIAMLTQFPFLMQDTDLIRETAYRCGYRNEKIIRKMQAAAMQHMQAQAIAGQAEGASAGGGANPQNAGATQAAQMQTPSIDNTVQQLSKQLQ